MKKLILLFGALIFFVLFNYCEQEVVDYRNSYTGEFKFTTLTNTKSMCYDSSETCVNGWMSYNFETTQITSHIEMFSENRLKIHFGDGALGHYNDSTYFQIFYPELSPDGSLYFPDYPRGGHNNIEGKFNGYDTLIMKFNFGFLIGGYDEYSVMGTRNK
jgi:hypothetical protein